MKHRDDGVNCDKSGGKITETAAATTVKTTGAVKAEAAVATAAASTSATPERIASTGGIAFLAPFVAAGGAYLATYLLRRKV